MSAESWCDVDSDDPLLFQDKDYISHEHHENVAAFIL